MRKGVGGGGDYTCNKIIVKNSSTAGIRLNTSVMNLC